MCITIIVCVFFFFLQAEDDIRDKLVTGVQTCALPISSTTTARSSIVTMWTSRLLLMWSIMPARSEERRVGKECRSRGSPYYLKEQKKTAQRGHGESVARQSAVSACDVSPLH